jgi:hypothetical protein
MTSRERVLDVFLLYETVREFGAYYYGEQQIDYIILSAPRVLAGQ